jgi:hypothetical protein
VTERPVRRALMNDTHRNTVADANSTASARHHIHTQGGARRLRTRTPTGPRNERRKHGHVLPQHVGQRLMPASGETACALRHHPPRGQPASVAEALISVASASLGTLTVPRPRPIHHRRSLQTGGGRQIGLYQPPSSTIECESTLTSMICAFFAGDTDAAPVVPAVLIPFAVDRCPAGPRNAQKLGRFGGR